MDVLIDFLRRQPKAILLLEAHCLFWGYVVSVAELYVGVRNGREWEVVDEQVELLRTVKIDTKIAR